MALTAEIKAILPRSFTFSGTTASVVVPYHIRTSENTNPEAVRALTGFPKYGSACPFAAGLLCNNVSIETVNGHYYIAEATYSNEGGSSGGSDDPEKPWNDPPVIEPIDDRKTVVIERAYADETAAAAGGEPTIAILNPAGDLFDNPPQEEIDQVGVRISWNKQTFNESQLSYLHTVNSAAVTINGTTYPAQTLFLATFMPWKRSTPSGATYYALTAEIKYDRNKHRATPLFYGWKAVDYLDNTAKKVYIKDDGEFTFDPAEGEPITEPVLLNSTGNLLASTQSAMRAATAVYGDFIIHPIKDWSGLNIPSVSAVKRGAGA